MLDGMAGPVVRQCRLRPRGAGRAPPTSRCRSCRTTTPSSRRRPSRRAARDEARRAARRQSAARVLQQLRLGGERHGVPPRAPLLDDEGPAAAADLHQPLERLSRLDRGRRQPRRHEDDARAGRPADPGHRARHAALSVRRRLRRRSGSLWRRARRRDRGAHPRVGPAERRGLHRRAGPGRGRRDHPAGGLLEEVEAICRKYGILLVSDEVICGFGRLGRWFGFQHFGIKPDIVSMAKGLSSGYLPISATGVSADDRRRRCATPAASSSTATPIPAIRPPPRSRCKNIEIMERERLVERTAEDTGPYLAKALSGSRGHPLVGEARSLGLIGAVEIVPGRARNERFAGKEGTAGPIVRDICIQQRPDGARDPRHARDVPAADHHPCGDRPLGRHHRAALDEAEPTLRALPAAA